MIVDLALSVTGSQLIASTLPTVRFCLVVSLWLSDLVPLRPTRIKGRFSMNASEATSSLSEVAKLAQRSSGYCTFLFYFHPVDLILVFFLSFSDRMVR
jgi:hypothetical protein